jgi:uncharacterized membrane protein HdeD (DUF308 family)
MKSINPSELIQFTAKPRWYTIQGKAMIFIGGGLAILSIVSPNVYMLGKNASWVPVIGIIVLLVGIMRCLDGLASETAQGKLYNMQGGILDVVVGFLVAFSTNDEVNYLNLLIVGYLLTQGLYRNILLSVAKIRNPLPNRVTGLISILLGIMIWIDWPASLWFLAFSLSVDISFRGWALTVLASSLKKETTTENESVTH